MLLLFCHCYYYYFFKPFYLFTFCFFNKIFFNKDAVAVIIIIWFDDHTILTVPPGVHDFAEMNTKSRKLRSILRHLQFF